MEIQLLENRELEETAKFLTRLNSNPTYHIGYVSKNSLEIQEDLQILLQDDESSAFIVKERGQIFGFIGVDGDQERSVGEIWGPFVEANNFQLGEQLLLYVQSNVYFNKLNLFFNQENQLLLHLAEQHHYTFQSRENILEIEKEAISSNEPVQKFTEEYAEQLIILHDQIFPQTYYSGSELIDNMNADGDIYIIVEHHHLLGYVYVELDYTLRKGSIEFLGVNNRVRKQGIGTKLLKMTLSDLFRKNIDLIQLCVNTTNEKALSLYHKCGFSVKERLNFYQKAKI
ncbi:GNAT family N-acetyltransferase [Bacillus sp. 31A1R]|uniref:GNAT family N-acetyltransferase n=1 Tax=Robertmurraya mangrovi TaxID=3098077 RepID=A0ABU5J012_9BACI|nr:GNAT family N-acetyltransferase [Bacillus sp. 31A1R]MDZ5472731.1 GNAT family N-acetyltransferase [Bacillus sp. 31A1R]